ncbi:MAG: hypothetical protein Q4A05_03610 [Ruminococcus sp.]|nr:hypothetical protein [Ruminococcus sp.]
MPFCEYCGRPIGENEVCNCRSGEAPTPPPPVYVNGQPVYGAPQKKSGGLWWIWLIIVPIVLVLLMFLILLAAIFVPAYIGYNKKAKITSANASASSIYKAANCALAELDEEDNKINGRYIIASDPAYNQDVPLESFDLDGFYYKIENYSEDATDNEWFVIIENGMATYAAEAESWTSDTVGTYPSRATVDGPCIYGSYYTTSTRYRLSEVYDKSSSAFTNKSTYSDDYSYTYY